MYKCFRYCHHCGEDTEQYYYEDDPCYCTQCGEDVA